MIWYSIWFLCVCFNGKVEREGNIWFAVSPTQFWKALSWNWYKCLFSDSLLYNGNSQDLNMSRYKVCGFMISASASRWNKPQWQLWRFLESDILQSHVPCSVWPQWRKRVKAYGRCWPSLSFVKLLSVDLCLTTITSNHRYNEVHFPAWHGTAITLEEKPYAVAGWERHLSNAEEVQT